MRDKELRIRLTPEEKEQVEELIKNGKKSKLWTNNRTFLNKLIENWNTGQIKGKFIH